MGDVDPWVAFERLSHLDPAHLTHAQRRLLALGGLRTEVNNGGFHQYFFNSDLAHDAVDAAEASGVTELALLIRRALDLLDVQDPADRRARQDSLDDLDPEQFADIDDAYYALEASADLDSAMRGFIELTKTQQKPVTGRPSARAAYGPRCGSAASPTLGPDRPARSGWLGSCGD
jgi:hypothetical protein